MKHKSVIGETEEKERMRYPRRYKKKHRREFRVNFPCKREKQKNTEKMIADKTVPSRERNSPRRGIIFRISALWQNAVDPVVILGVLFLVFTFTEPAAWRTIYVLTGLSAALVFSVAFNSVRPFRCTFYWDCKKQVSRVLFVWVGSVLFSHSLTYGLSESYALPPTIFWLWAFATPIVMVGWRFVRAYFLRNNVLQANSKKRAVVWGSGGAAEEFAGLITDSLQLETVVEKDIDNIQPENTIYLRERSIATKQLSAAETLELMAQKGELDILFILIENRKAMEVDLLIERLANSVVSIFLVPACVNPSWRFRGALNLGGYPLIEFDSAPIGGVNGQIKRLVDIFVSGVALVIFLIPMILIAIGIKISSPGPVIFRQRRFGLGGKEITVLKFRTMRTAREEIRVPQATQNDPRVTRFGAFLRQTSLDELPQFFNVLAGTMSIVGPRPHAVVHNEYYRDKINNYMLRHQVRPGITGWAQVNGWRGETDTVEKMEKRVDYDLWYIENWSVLLDLKIILMTVLSGFSSKNAY